MTPAAHIAAAAEILDDILDGAPAEKALTGWARRSRFAGSKDRAAIRDHVFDALRCRRSFGLLGGAETGRALMLGQMIADGRDPSDIFTGEGHAPAPLSPEEEALVARDPAQALSDAPRAEACDMPDWVWPMLDASLPGQAEEVARNLRHRAPVFLRVNLRKTDPARAIADLAEDGIVAEPHPLAETALTLTEGARKVAHSGPYQDGHVELQDAASQAVVASLPLANGLRVLDYCAGGGGKTLAMAGRADAEFTAHDALPARMKDLPDRAARAGVQVNVTDRPDGPYDIVLCDVPCSGSGAWRRSPDGKWRLTEAGFADLLGTQSEILDLAAPLVAPGGVLAYATCSVLAPENRDQVEAFLSRHPEWDLTTDMQWLPTDGGDGFYLAQLTRSGVTS